MGDVLNKAITYLYQKLLTEQKQLIIDFSKIKESDLWDLIEGKKVEHIEPLNNIDPRWSLYEE